MVRYILFAAACYLGIQCCEGCAKLLGAFLVLCHQSRLAISLGCKCETDPVTESTRFYASFPFLNIEEAQRGICSASGWVWIYRKHLFAQGEQELCVLQGPNTANKTEMRHWLCCNSAPSIMQEFKQDLHGPFQLKSQWKMDQHSWN